MKKLRYQVIKSLARKIFYILILITTHQTIYINCTQNISKLYYLDGNKTSTWFHVGHLSWPYILPQHHMCIPLLKILTAEKVHIRLMVVNSSQPVIYIKTLQIDEEKNYYPLVSFASLFYLSIRQKLIVEQFSP